MIVDKKFEKSTHLILLNNKEGLSINQNNSKIIKNNHEKPTKESNFLKGLYSNSSIIHFLEFFSF